MKVWWMRRCYCDRGDWSKRQCEGTRWNKDFGNHWVWIWDWRELNKWKVQLEVILLELLGGHSVTICNATPPTSQLWSPGGSQNCIEVVNVFFDPGSFFEKY